MSTKKRRTIRNDEKLADYVRQCADRMHLREWTIYVSSDPDDEPENGIDEATSERCGSFVGTFGRQSASVWFHREYLEHATRDEIRQTTAHELLHAIWHRTREVAIMLAGMAGENPSETLLGVYDVTSEYAIDEIADLIAPTLPLPPL